jgi:hypothetical protein
MDLKEHFNSLNETQKRGQATEALLKTQFTVRDISILTPEYDNEPYDFAIEVDDSFYKIQAKTAYSGPRQGTVRFETVSTKARSDGYVRTSYEDLIDFFAVYNPHLSESYLISVEEAATGKMEIRFVEAKNNQQKGINWHEEFLLDRKLCSLRSE